MKSTENIKKETLASFSVLLKSKIEDFVIRDKDAFITLKAESSKEANDLENLKKECEEKVKQTKFFENVYVTFTVVEKKFKNIIAVTSCKGGVGKSTVAANLALSLSAVGYKIGILDADIYGPSIPKILKIIEKPEVNEKKKIIPLKFKDIEVISIGLLVDEKKPIIWRGPMIQSALMQLVSDVSWSNLDVLILDLPPGTGDPHLTLMQKLNISHSIVVTTNEEIAIADTRKGINMLLKLNIPISGVIENMSYFKLPNSNEKHYIFGKNGVKKLCEEFNLKLLAEIPIISGDEKIILSKKNQKLTEEYNNLVKTMTSLF